MTLARLIVVAVAWHLALLAAGLIYLFSLPFIAVDALLSDEN